MRLEGRTLAEVGALGIVPAHRRTGAVYLLKKITFRCAFEHCGVDDLMMAVHPRSEDLYRAALGSRRIGPVRKYPGLNEAAVSVALRLDLRTFRGAAYEAYGHLPKDARNPHYMYWERTDPQIRMPSNARSIERRFEARREAGAALLGARESVLSVMSQADRAYVVESLRLAKKSE